MRNVAIQQCSISAKKKLTCHPWIPIADAAG
jgi:hypothetical protein